jgi:methylmalonyl-CoA/ethylmalonyl-CoA epimerase
MLRKIHHVGIVTGDFNKAVQRFEEFGLSCREVIKNDEIGINAAFFLIGDSLIELIKYTDSAKTHDNVVRSQKGIINHLCFEVGNLEVSIREFEQTGAKLVEGFPRDGASGHIAFFYPETTEGILIELCQV